MSVVNAIPLIAAGDDGYSISRSLRFRSSASAYLSRTPATTTNQTTWTWSAWVKRGVLSQQQTLFGAANSGDPFLQLVYDSSANCLDFIYYVAGVVGRKTTTAAYRDPSSWYHVLVNWDTTNATAGDRMRIYVNGSRVTSFSASTDPAQNTTGTVNSSSYGHSIGRLFSTTNPFDGYMAEVNFIDGQQLAPTAFGEYSPYNQWLPKKYDGTYGTNGFRLPFTDNTSTTTLGYDFSIAAYSDNLRSSGTNTGTFTANGGLAAAFDGNTNQPNASSAKVSAPAAGYNTAVIGKDWGAGVTKTITAVRLFSQNDGGFVGGTTNALTFKLQGSNDDSAWTDLTSAITGPATGAGTLISVTSGITTTTAYRYHRINVNANGADNYYMCELEFYEAGTHGFNNWTTNNISVTAGSTYDSMTDVPTLTSATAANYAVLNPLDTLVNTLTNGNLYLSTTSASYGGSRASIAIPTTGKWYWETTVSTQTGTAGDWVVAGMGLSTVALNSFIGGVAGSIFYGERNDLAFIYNETTTVTSGGSLFVVTGDVMQCAYDASTGKFWFGKNDTWWSSAGAGTGNPSAGTNNTLTAAAGTYFPFGQVRSGGGALNAISLNFGQRPFTYTPPTGFLALNTFNL